MVRNMTSTFVAGHYLGGLWDGEQSNERKRKSGSPTVPGSEAQLQDLPAMWK